MLRRLNDKQPEKFKFSVENRKWIKKQIKKYPAGREASAVIPVLWRAQEQEGWISQVAIEEVAKILKMAPIRVLEVATFYFMFHLKPVGSIAHLQVCGTTPCMLCESEELVNVCRKMISKYPHTCSEDGKLSWEEVECLGACANAPVVQIGKDYYEDLSAVKLEGLIEQLREGKIPVPGSQDGRYSSEPKDQLSSLKVKRKEKHNASVYRAIKLKDTTKRILGE